MLQILSFYQMNKKDFEFLLFIDKYLQKYPFKCFNIMDTLLDKEIVYIKNTTMIIDLLKLSDSIVVNIFDFFKDMLRCDIIKKIIYKKEVLFIYFYNDFIISFFDIKNKWLLIPLVIEISKSNYPYYFDVYVLENNIFKLIFLVINKDYYVSIDIKKIDRINNNHYPLVISFYSNKDNNLKFSFDKLEFINNLKLKL